MTVPRRVLSPRRIPSARWILLLAGTIALLNAGKATAGEERIHHRDALSRAIIDAFPDLPTLIDFGFPDHLCGTWHHAYTRMHQQIRAASKAGPTGAPPDAPPVRFLTFDGLQHCDSLGETLMGLTSAFTVALLTNRAFIIRHPCIPMAFEPALIDWHPSEDVGFEPLRNETDATGQQKPLVFPLDPPNKTVQPPIGAGDIVEVNLELNPQANPETVFPQVDAARNVRVVWNRELLVHMLKASSGSAWGKKLTELGVRIPYAFGCFVRYLLRPKPEIWHRMQPFEKHLRGDKVVSIGMHVRQFGRGIPPVNTTVSTEDLEKSMEDVVGPAVQCARNLEGWWYPPTLNVKWLVISDSLQLKEETQKQLNDTKIIITEYTPWVPASLLTLAQNPPPPPPLDAAPPSTAAPSLSPPTPPPIPPAATFQETVTEWLLLSSCNSFIVSSSAFGRTAAMYSMHPMSIYTPQSCEPQSPVRVSSFGEGSKRQLLEQRGRGLMERGVEVAGRMGGVVLDGGLGVEVGGSVRDSSSVLGRGGKKSSGVVGSAAGGEAGRNATDVGTLGEASGWEDSYEAHVVSEGVWERLEAAQRKAAVREEVGKRWVWMSRKVVGEGSMEEESKGWAGIVRFVQKAAGLLGL